MAPEFQQMTDEEKQIFINAIMLIFDKLEEDPQSQSIIEEIYNAETDEAMKSAIRKAVTRLIEMGEHDVANKVKELITGYAF